MLAVWTCECTRWLTCLFAYSMAASNSLPSHISRGRFSLRFTRFKTTNGFPYRCFRSWHNRQNFTLLHYFPMAFPLNLCCCLPCCIACARCSLVDACDMSTPVCWRFLQRCHRCRLHVSGGQACIALWSAAVADTRFDLTIGTLRFRGTCGICALLVLW